MHGGIERMSMSTYVQGLKPKTTEYQKMLDILCACKEINIKPPKEIVDFFDGEICEDGIVTEIPKEAVREYADDYCREFFEVDLAKLPPDVTKIRFVNSY